MIEFLEGLNLLQITALGGVAVLLVPVMWDAAKWLFRKIPGVVGSRKPRVRQPGVTFEHVMEIRELLVKDDNGYVLEAFDGSIVPAIVRALAEEKQDG